MNECTATAIEADSPTLQRYSGCNNALDLAENAFIAFGLRANKRDASLSRNLFCW